MPARLALALVVLGALIAPVSAFSSSASPATSLARQVLTEMNATRRAHGLAPLRSSAALNAAAADHSREMARNGYFSHDSADGSPFWKRVQRYYPSGSGRGWSVGENLLWSSPSIGAAGAIRAWLKSHEHRRNMLDPRWRDVGISTLHVAAAPGVFDGLEVTLVTADFGVR
jgi:uncharacterized protein YkwD